LESEGEVARLIQALPDLGLGRSGLVVANPIPEEEQLDPDLHDRALRAGIVELERGGVRGKEVTPYLLDHLREETKGESLELNKKIIVRNASLAARVAVALAALGERS